MREREKLEGLRFEEEDRKSFNSWIEVINEKEGGEGFIVIVRGLGEVECNFIYHKNDPENFKWKRTKRSKS